MNQKAVLQESQWVILTSSEAGARDQTSGDRQRHTSERKGLAGKPGVRDSGSWLMSLLKILYGGKKVHQAYCNVFLGARSSSREACVFATAGRRGGLPTDVLLATKTEASSGAGGRAAQVYR